MTDDAMIEHDLERDLRAMLARRDPGPARIDLAAEIRLRLAAERRRGWRERLAGPVTAAALIAAALILALVVTRPIAIGPGATIVPEPAVPYVIAPGDGVVTGEYFPLVQAVLAVMAVSALGWLYRTSLDRRRRVGAALGILGIGLVAMNIGTSDAISDRYENRGGFEALDPGGIDPTGGTGSYVDVTGDQPFRLEVTVANSSRLPLEVLGMAGPNDLNDRVPRLVGVGILIDRAHDFDVAPRRPFEPTLLGPGETLDLTFIGRAGTCAIRPADQSSGGSIAIDHVVIVYEQLTIRHWATFVLPEPVHVAWPEGGC